MGAVPPESSLWSLRMVGSGTSAGSMTVPVVFMSLMCTISSGSKGGLGLILCCHSKFHVACCFLSNSLVQNSSKSGHLGFSCSGHVGIVVLSFLPMSSSAVEYPHARGVDLYASSALVGSFSFFNMDFTVLTAHSTSPFALGYLGLDVDCFIPQSLVN